MGYRLLLWRDKLLLLSLLALFYGYSSLMRVTIRAVLEGREFQWAYVTGVAPDGSSARAIGHGLFGHAEYLLTGSFALVWLLAAGMRRPDRLFQAALFGWTSIGMGVSLWLTLHFGDELTTSKETLGLTNMSYFTVEFLPRLVAWGLALTLLMRGSRDREEASPVPWVRANTSLMTAALAFLLVAALLLNVGPQHGWADFNGIGMTYIALILFLLGLAPWEKPAPREQSVPA